MLTGDQRTALLERAEPSSALIPTSWGEPTGQAGEHTDAECFAMRVDFSRSTVVFACSVPAKRLLWRERTRR